VFILTTGIQRFFASDRRNLLLFQFQPWRNVTFMQLRWRTTNKSLISASHLMT